MKRETITILEAKKECEKLQEQIEIIQHKYSMGDGTLVRMHRDREIDPLQAEWNELMTSIQKAENETEIVWKK